MNDSYDIVVIGAGPAGLLAAGRAASFGKKVVLLEKMEKPARKLRITGKGRCNVTNVKPIDDYFKEISPNSQFLEIAFRNFFYQDSINLLQKNGVETILERGQRVFPKSGKAWDVAEGLIKWAKSSGVIINHFSQVVGINTQVNKISSIVVRNSKTGKEDILKCMGVIIATGGKSYPLTGSTGDGFNFARELGHKIVNPFPSLVGLEAHPIIYRAVGLMLKNVQVNLIVDDVCIQSEFGELEITEYGFDGPIILRISRNANESIIQNKNVSISLDLKPALTHQKLSNRITREISQNSNGDYLYLLKKLLPSQLVPFLVKYTEIDPRTKISALNEKIKDKLTDSLKALSFQITGNRGWDEAIVTAGGVSTKEVNPYTMESKLVKGLYFAGEILDVDGNTGGYNLQIAFSTGWLAGESAAKSLLLDKEIKH